MRERTSSTPTQAADHAHRRAMSVPPVMLLVFLLAAGGILGCGGASGSDEAGQSGVTKASRKPSEPKRPQKTRKQPSRDATPTPAKRERPKPKGAGLQPGERFRLQNPQKFSELNDPSAIVDPADQPVVMPAARPIDEARVAAAGIRRIPGRHLTLYTDLPRAAVIDELPAAFDAAFEPLCRYFGRKPELCKAWQMNGFLMKDSSRFVRAGLLPPQIPEFKNGYQDGREIWLYDQTSDYYRRHLMLHEGVHGFMALVLGGTGPPWYAEGMAEMLATHRWQNGKMELNVIPQRREEVPGWGRIELVRRDVAKGQVPSVLNILNYGPTAHLQNAPYAWSWALCALLDRHPQFQKRFRGLSKYCHYDTASMRELFATEFRPDQWQFFDQWALFVYRLDYGYDIPREAIQFAAGRPVPATGAAVDVDAARCWQSSGLLIEKGQT